MAPPTKSVATARQEKERRQKKLLLFVLLPALAIAIAIQGPKLKDLFSNAQEKTSAVQGDVVEGFKEVAPTVPTETAPGAVSSDPTAVAISATEGLSDTDAAPKTDEGQLISFTRFDAQDPFVQLVSDETPSDQGDAVPADAAPATDSSTAPTSTVGATPTPTASTPPPTTTTGGSTDTAVSGASISVNGSVVLVTVGQNFPENDPAFTVVSIEDNVVKIGLAGGSFSNGVDTIDLRVGDTVTLISQPDGARFQLKVVKIS
jgi:hypothetical protein